MENNYQEFILCQFCGKACKNSNSLKNHELRCRNNPNRSNYQNFSNYIEKNRKGKNKYNCEEIAKQSETLKELYRNGSLISARKGTTGTFTGKKHSEESKQLIGKKVSFTRKERFANGSISPAKGVGLGKYSYVKYKDKTYMCRSTYEFIYALYLIYNNIDFNMENIRVKAKRSNPYSNTFICDFNIGNKIVEIKGIPSGKDVYIKESFEAAGYEFEELFQKDIEKCSQWLKQINIPVDTLLNKIIEGHNSKEYFVYIV